MLARQQVLSRPIKIELQKASDLPEVEHDSDQVHQVLLNLLLNAVQAMEKAGTVHVEIGSRQGYASVVVTDTGRGISPQNLPNIFRPFYTTKGNGTGLGLSLAHRIVEDHHGRIEVSSVLGKGSQFTVLLPFHVPRGCTWRLPRRFTSRNPRAGRLVGTLSSNWRYNGP